MMNNNDFSDELQKRFTGIKSKLKIESIDISEVKIALHKKRKKKLNLMIACVIICIIIGGWVRETGIFNTLPLNDPSPSELIASGKALKTNISCKDKDITLTVRAILADSERTLIEINVNKKNLNSSAVPDLDDTSIKLTDQNNKTYMLNSWGGSCGENQHPVTVEVTQLGFDPLPLDTQYLMLTINKIDGISGKWQVKLPVNVLKPNEVNLNLVTTKDNTIIHLNKVVFSGSLIKIEGKISGKDNSNYIQWDTSDLKLNGKTIDYLEDYKDQDGNFYIEFSSTALNGDLVLTLQWDDNSKREISIPAK